MSPCLYCFQTNLNLGQVLSNSNNRRQKKGNREEAIQYSDKDGHVCVYSFEESYTLMLEKIKIKEWIHSCTTNKTRDPLFANTGDS